MTRILLPIACVAFLLGACADGAGRTGWSPAMAPSPGPTDMGFK